ncbi:MAG: rubrerythrin family protein [Rickettsiales bacterium]|jgi:rubrerythrin|nr:rubrerythrin family protein [Rickettsiales bacterium]
MAKNLDGTKTKENLLFAFIGESQARNKYTYYASKAKNEGYAAIGKIFEETAGHEKEHAERLFKFLEDTEPVEIHNVFSSGKIGTTAENLQEAINGEHHEYDEMYPTFAKIAREEGFPELAVVFENIGKAEVYHEQRYLKLLKDIEVKTLLAKNDLIVWKCTNCGYHIKSKNAPAKCPACNHDVGYFVEVDNILF